MQTATESSTCLVSGAGGYLGACVKNALAQRGWRAIELTRHPGPHSGAPPFRLGEDVPTLPAGAALVHCAYDFTLRNWQDLHRVNVAGSEKLFRAARDAGIKNLLYISSVAAFAGCRSLYGQAKLETEKIALGFGAVVIRPGMIWGNPPGAMFARLVNQVEHARVLPLFGGGQQIQYLVHDQDLADVICRCTAGTISAPRTPVTVAHEQPWTFRQILEEIARARGKKISFVPAPWRLAWLVIKLAETCGLQLNFRSDSLLSLMHQNPKI